MTRGLCILSVLLLGVSWSLAREDAAPPPAPADHLEQTNTQAMLDAILLLQTQISSNQVAIERSRTESKEAAAFSAEALSRGLQEIENVISAQQQSFAARSARELEVMQDSNRLMLGLAGTFAAIAFAALLVTAYFQWRMSRAWAGVSRVLQGARALGRSSGVAALSAGAQSTVAAGGSVKDSNQRLLGAMEQLKKQIEALEDASKAALKLQPPGSRSGDNGALAPAPGTRTTTGTPPEPSGNGDDPIPALLRQGQSLLRENDFEGALKCFDEILSLNPNHGEALVRKGATLERLKKLTEAIECYDRAIAADESMTLAYLYKGGLCNRLERFKEALECYDKALQTQAE